MAEMAGLCIGIGNATETQLGMKLLRQPARDRGMTLIEVAIVIVAMLLLGILLVYSIMLQRGRSKHGPGHARIKCANNLKQIGLAYKVFANDNDDKFPFVVAGSLAFGNVTQSWLHFQLMSNELGSAKILSCPLDRDRRNDMAFEFGMGALATSNSLSSKSNRAVSYFATLDAGETLPDSFVSGDRHLETNRWNMDGRLFLAISNRPASWVINFHDSGPGNVALADGSVRQLTSSDLANAVRFQGISTNRLLLPLLP